MKRMIAVFEKHAYRYDPSSLFTHFLELVIIGFDQTFKPIEKPLSKEEGQACMELLSAWVLTMNDELKHREWFDALGELYMTYLASKGKKSSNGQFFSPMHICDFMTAIVDPAEGNSVMDNACGSGRMLLAAHVKSPRLYCCAQDIDYVCCLMTVCNFIIHGVNGEVIWGDGLDPSDYRQGWRTNELLNVLGVPCVRDLDKMQSRIYLSGQRMKDEHAERKHKEENPVEVHVETPKFPQQLSLFDFDDAYDTDGKM